MTTSPSRLSQNGSSTSSPARPMSQRDHHDLAVPAVDERAAERREQEARAACARPSRGRLPVPESRPSSRSRGSRSSPIQSPRLDDHLRAEPEPQEPRHAEHRPRRRRHRLRRRGRRDERRRLAHAPVSLGGRSLTRSCVASRRLRRRCSTRPSSSPSSRPSSPAFFAAFFAVFLAVFLAVFFAAFLRLASAPSRRAPAGAPTASSSVSSAGIGARGHGRVHAAVGDVRAVATFEHAHRRARCRGARRARRSAASAGGRAAASAARTAPRLRRA